MDIRIGYELTYQLIQPTPMMLMLNVHPSRHEDLAIQDHMVTNPVVPITVYRDVFDNVCSRLLAPPGTFTISASGLIRDHGAPDREAPWAQQTPVENLPDDVLVFLLGSRYCETDRLSDIAWNLFGGVAPGWSRVRAIVDFVHSHISFGYEHAWAMRSAWDAYHDRRGVCRDFTHLAVAFCRCMNIPARYCTGYLGDIGVPLAPFPMDFSAWFEAYLDGAWYTFDARHGVPRIGRVVIARGRDATDVAISNTFGPNALCGFHVTTDEISYAG